MSHAVVVTSAWAAARLAGRIGATPVVVAEPGTDPAPGDADVDRVLSAGGGHLLCLAAVTPRKGQRVLAAALARLDAADAVVGPGRGAVAGPGRVGGARRRRGLTAPLAGRVDVTGPATGAALEAHWRWADLLVVPSLVETYGMVVTEALARGVPALVTTGSALPATLGRTGSGPPGLLVPPATSPRWPRPSTGGSPTRRCVATSRPGRGSGRCTCPGGRRPPRRSPPPFGHRTPPGPAECEPRARRAGVSRTWLTPGRCGAGTEGDGAPWGRCRSA